MITGNSTKAAIASDLWYNVRPLINHIKVDLQRVLNDWLKAPFKVSLLKSQLKSYFSSGVLRSYKAQKLLTRKISKISSVQDATDLLQRFINDFDQEFEEELRALAKS